MQQHLEKADESFVSFNKEEGPEHVMSHQQADETAALYEATTLRETVAAQEIEDDHAVQSPISAYDVIDEEPVRVEVPTTSISGLMAFNAPPTQIEATTTSCSTPTPPNAIPVTSNQPTQLLEGQRGIRPGELLTNKDTEVHAVTSASPSDHTLSISAYTAERNSLKHQLVEDENEEPVGYIDERSTKRTRSTDSRKSIGDRSTPVRRSYPSTWDGYEWALVNENMRHGPDQALDLNSEDRPAPSIVDLSIMDQKPIIKQDPDELPMNALASSHSITLTPTLSVSSIIRQPPTGPNAATEHVDLFSLCIPCTGPNGAPLPASENELSLLADIQRKARRILSGEKDRVDIRSRIPAWMRNGLSEEQKKGIVKIQKKINTMQKKIRASQSEKKGGNVKAKGANTATTRPTPTPTKYTSASVMHWQTFHAVAPTPSQAHPLARQQTLLPFGLEPLDYGNLFGPALVYSALEQVNNMLEMFEANVRCSLSGLDLINLQKSTGRVQNPPPPGCASLSLANQPYPKLVGPSLVHHALQEINEMMRSFGLLQQFALCWKDLRQVQH